MSGKPPIPAETLEAQFRASDPRTSSWASANAGAGKTHVLTARVARLLLAGNRPDRILCITYTKAAAAEMKTRLFGRLGQWSTMDDDALDAELQTVGAPPVRGEERGARLAEARRLFARSLETPGGLKIQTIHSFCQLVLSRFPLEAGLQPGFEILGDQLQSEVLGEARTRVLAGADDFADLGEAMILIGNRIDETVFDELLNEIKNQQRAFGNLAPGARLSEALDTLHRVIGVEPDQSEDDVLDAAIREGDALPLQTYADTLEAGAKTDQKFAGIIRTYLKAENKRLGFEAYKGIFIKPSDGEPRKDVMTKTHAKNYPHIADGLAREQSRIIAVEERRRTVRVAEASRALLVIAAYYLQFYRALKDENGVLDYDDLIHHTKQLLTGADASAWVLYKLDSGVDHVLIDEAQDTSPEQWQIARALAEEFFAGSGAAEEQGRVRTIFAVGDEKQSIYSFQGAEPKAFGEMRSLFETLSTGVGARWDPVELTLSFRSAPQILAAVDQVFGDDISTRMVSVGAGSIRHLPWRAKARGLVELWPVVSPQDVLDISPWDAPLDRMGASSPPAVLAERIARNIGDWLRSGEILEATGKQVRPRDILILVRRRNAFVDTLIRKLKEARIPVAGTDRLLLTEHIAVMDLMALGAFALLPEDDLTLATLLKTPFFDWDEDALFALAHGRASSLWETLKTRRTERAEWERTVAALESVRERALQETPFNFYSWVLGETGGFRNLRRRLGPDAIDPIEEFLSLAEVMESEGIVSLQEFLMRLEASPPEIKRDMETGTGEDEAGEVRIMTVHGSKGLEAPIVILPDTCTKPDAKQDPKLLIHPDEEEAPILWPIRKKDDDPGCTEIRERLSARREAEYRRLLYVAMTRAEDRLYVCGYEGRRGRPDGCWFDLVFNALEEEAKEVPSASFGTVWRIGELGEAKAGREEAEVQELPLLPGWATRPPRQDKSPVRMVAPSKLAIDDPLDTHHKGPVLSPLARLEGGRYRRGRLIHTLLQLLPDLPPEARADAGAEYLARAAHDVEEGEADALLGEVMAIMEDPEFAPLFGPGSRAEVPLTGQVPELGDTIVIDGQVDRLVVTPTHVHLIDYKTNRPAPTELSRVPGAYISQMALYRALTQAVFPGRIVQCSLLWTDGPHRLVLPEAALDKAMKQLKARAKLAAS